jgi:hypothetical protein
MFKKRGNRPHPFRCPNCNEVIPFRKPIRIYCCQLCGDEARLVRYVRRCKREAKLDDPDVLDAIQTKFAHIMGGGYPLEERIVPASTRQCVIERAKGRCEKCGGEGKEIDHIQGNSNDPENLQLLCRECHKEKTFRNFVSITPDLENYQELEAKRTWLIMRIEAEIPILDCDNDETWKQRYRYMVNKRNSVASKWPWLFYDDKRLELVKKIVGYKKEGMTYEKIARFLTKERIPTPRGRRIWTRNMICHIMEHVRL